MRKKSLKFSSLGAADVCVAPLFSAPLDMRRSPSPRSVFESPPQVVGSIICYPDTWGVNRGFVCMRESACVCENRGGRRQRRDGVKS